MQCQYKAVPLYIFRLFMLTSPCPAQSLSPNHLQQHPPLSLTHQMHMEVRGEKGKRGAGNIW